MATTVAPPQPGDLGQAGREPQSHAPSWAPLIAQALPRRHVIAAVLAYREFKDVFPIEEWPSLREATALLEEYRAEHRAAEEEGRESTVDDDAVVRMSLVKTWHIVHTPTSDGPAMRERRAIAHRILPDIARVIRHGADEDSTTYLLGTADVMDGLRKAHDYLRPHRERMHTPATVLPMRRRCGQHRRQGRTPRRQRSTSRRGTPSSADSDPAPARRGCRRGELFFATSNVETCVGRWSS